MTSMFNRCSSLKNIDLSNFNTQNVENMNSMFSGCSSLVYANLYNFNPTIFHKKQYILKSGDPFYIFSGCSALKGNILIKDCEIRKIVKSLSN